jgi:hypothetical protein
MLTPSTVLQSHYLIERPIRADAHAVWVALDLQTRAHVALEHVPAERLATFETTASTLFVLRHPNLP